MHINNHPTGSIGDNRNVMKRFTGYRLPSIIRKNDFIRCMHTAWAFNIFPPNAKVCTHYAIYNIRILQ